MRWLTSLLALIIPAAACAEERPINFAHRIVPVFTRFGCNAGTCHGKAGGQNGFALSLLGFEPDEDYEYVVKEARGRRIFAAAPEQSLLVQKATGRMAHGGGKRIEPGSAYDRLLVKWIAQGAPRGRADDPLVTRLEVRPAEGTLPRGGTQQLTVRAHLSDGSIEDVTPLTQFEVNEPDLAEVSPDGLVTVKQVPGAVAVMARFQTHVAVFQAIVPQGAAVAKLPPARNFIDALVFKQLQRLGIPPSDSCSDAVFLRRATIDIAGRLPTLEETKEFLEDPGTAVPGLAGDPYARLIDRLLSSDDYADYFAGKWSAVLRNRRASPADDAKPTAAFHAWIRERLQDNVPLDRFVRELLTATGTENDSPPVLWYREVREPTAQVEDVAQLFLGQRIGCARCHHHPFEKWSQDDYWGMTAFFSRLEVKLPKVTKKGKQTMREPGAVAHKPGPAQATNPRTRQPVRPHGLGGPLVEVGSDEDPRGKLIDWMVARDNPFFARALVNRYWKHFLGRGLVEPEDDLRVSNPPANPELLDALARHFTEKGYDLKELIRTICTSQAYRLSAVPNEHNAGDRQNYSHFYVRRLHAEVLLDAIDTVTGARTQFKGLPEGTRAVQLPDNQFPSYFLSVFGRPESASACECERSSDASLAQSLYLANSDELVARIRGTKTPAPPPPEPTKGKNQPKDAGPYVVVASGGGRVEQFLKDPRSDDAKIRELYLTALCRAPAAEELDAVRAYIARHDERAAAYEDVIWALINTKEFLFNH